MTVGQLAIQAIINIVVIGIAVAALRIMLFAAIRNFETNLKGAVETFQHHCETVSGNLCRKLEDAESLNAKRFRAAESAGEKLWNAVNEHGHKGLNGENAKVTRG